MNETIKQQLKGRSFLTLKDFAPEEIQYFVDLAAQLKTVNGLGEKRIEAILVALEDMYFDDTIEEV